MDILKFLRQGNVSVNPEYNPKTKKGALEPPTLVNYNPSAALSDQGRSSLGQTIARNQYDLNQYDIDKYSEYDVYVSPNILQEELDKERANNQSVFEQSLRMIGQIGNEMTVGTAVGIADLADVIYQALSGQISDTDYQNEFINSLEEFKESINEQLEIYRKNPNKAWDVTDFGWWASNAPSIASTVSLMVPGIGVSKGLSALGKGVSNITKGTRLAKNALKARNAVLRTQKSREIAGQVTNAATGGLTMRLLENYQEARQTYNDVLEYATDKLSSMSDLERTQFIQNNPQYSSMSDEEIAADVAKNSADVTFETDWINAAFDVMQMYGLRNIWSGTLRGSSTASMRNLNTMAAKMFGNEGKAITEAVANRTLWAKTKQGLGNFAKDSLTGVRAEWTEGIEEAINYISQQEGMYAGKKVFDKNTPITTMEDYLKDPHMWEQAFWGALGGVAFSTIGNKVGSFVQKRLNSEWQTAEKQHEAEILGRAARFNEYQNQINLIAQGKNPFLTSKDEAGNTVNPDIIAGQEEQLRVIAEKEYVDNLVVDAANAGNLDLLKEFVKDSNVAKGFQEKLGITANEATQMQQRILKRIEATEDLYNNIINKVNELGGGFEVGKIIASKQIRANNLANQYDQLINWSENNIQTELNNPANNITRETVANAELGIINYHIENLRTSITNVQNDPTIPKSRKAELTADYEAQINGLVEQYNFNTYTEEDIKNFTNEAFALKRTNKDLYNALYGKINAIRGKVSNSIIVNNNEEHLQKEINYLNNFLDKARVKVIEGAEVDLKKMYNKYSIEEVDNVIAGQTVDTVTNEDKKIINNAYAALNINAKGNAFLETRLNDFKRMLRAKEGNEQQVEQTIEEENLQTDDTVAEENVVQSPSPTGGQEKTITAESAVATESVVSDNTPSPVEEETVPPSPTEAARPQQPQNNLPSEDDYIARGNLANDAISEYIANAGIDINNNDEIRSNLNNFIQAVVQTGLPLEEAKQYAQDIVDELTGDLSFSSVNDVAVMARAATLGILTKQDAYFEQLINEFVNSIDQNGNPRGRTLNGIKYVSIGQLTAFLKESTNSKAIYNLLFDAMKDYLFSSTREQAGIRLIDEGQLEEIRNNPRAFSNYVDEIIATRYNTLKEGIINRVNVTLMANNPDFKTFITVNPEDELTTQYDAIKNRILLKKDNIVIGYLGVPTVDTATGDYIMDNENWYYHLSMKNGIVDSGFKDALFKVFVYPNTANDEYISRVYNVAIELAKNKGIITSEIYQELLDMYGLFKKLYPEIINSFGTRILNDDMKVSAMHHLVKISEAGLFGNVPQDESIINWFNRLYESYAQATNIMQGNFKGKITVRNINYGKLNNPAEGQEFNSINETVVGYNEDVNQIGVAYGNQMFYSGEVLGISTKATTGVAQMRISKPDGSYMNANLQFVKIADRTVSKEAQQIVGAAINKIADLIQQFIDNPVNYNFTQLYNDLSELIYVNPKGIKNNERVKRTLFRGVDMVVVPNQSIAFKIGNDFAFTINARNNIVTANPNVQNLPHNVSTKGLNIYYKEAILTEEFKKFLLDNLRESFRNVMFASSASLINDKTRQNDDKTNKFVKRINGKTIIDFGEDNTWEFNSYQDLLVSTNAIRINLRNTEGEGFAGNWKYDRELTKLNINYVIEPVELSEVTEITSDEVNNMLVDTPTDINDFKNTLASEDLQIGLTEFFKEDKYAVNYINDLTTLGLIPKTIRLQNGIVRNGKQVNAKYDNKKDIISINTKKLAGRQYGRTLRIIVHESIHQKLNNYYDRTEVYKQILPVFEQFREAIRNGTATKLDANITDYLFAAGLDTIDLNNKDHRDALEDFFIESMTAKRLMDVLNQIEYKDDTVEKKQNLFTKLIEIIAKMFGLKINEDSLLAAARNIYSNISEKQIIDSEVSTATTEETEPQLPFTEQEEIETKTSQNTNDELIIDEDDEFSSVDDVEIPNLYSLADNIPYELRADFNEMVSTGQLSYACM